MYLKPINYDHRGACFDMNIFLFALFKTAYGVVFFIITVLILFFSGGTYSYKKEFLLSNTEIFFVIIAIYVICIAFFLLYKRKELYRLFHFPITIDKTVAITTVCLFITQLFVFYNAFFFSGWDSNMVRSLADTLITGSDQTDISLYLSQYPNNLLISYIYYFLQKFIRSFEFFSTRYSYMCIVVVNCVINCTTCLLTYKTTKVFATPSTALLAYCLVVFCCGSSGWSIIWYSDALTLFSPILCVYLYCKEYRSDKMSYIGLAAIGTVSAISYFLKPQCLFVFIAAVLLEGVHLVQNYSLKSFFRPIVLCISAVFIWAMVNTTLNTANQKYGIHIDSSKPFGMSHFLMMGANEQTNGGYWAEDVLFSAEFVDPNQRSEANYDVFVHRIKEMGTGVVAHLQKKMLTTFNDGSFAWGMESRFFMQFPKTHRTSIASFIKSVYCGNNRSYLETIQHCTWLFVLFFSLVTVTINKNYTHKRELSLVWITLLGFVLYELLFEVRARYVYIFVPLFCCLAAIGFRNVTLSILTRINNITNYRYLK